MARHHVQLPMSEEDALKLRAGDQVLLSGVCYTARDAAHKRMSECLARGEALPFPLEGQAIYYVGPTPAKPGEVIGSAGPTTAGRMDAYTPALLERGLRCMIGKGYRNQEVRAAIVRHRAVYLVAIGGVGALLAKHIVAAELVAWDDLGTEAVRRLVLQDFPTVVVHDCYGGDLYEEGLAEYRRDDS